MRVAGVRKMIVPVVLLVASALGVTAARLVADDCAYQQPACTFYNNHEYAWGTCEPSQGSQCDFCYYYCEPGWAACGEAHDGSERACATYNTWYELLQHPVP